MFVGAAFVVAGAPVIDPPSGDVHANLDRLFIDYLVEPVFVVTAICLGVLMIGTFMVMQPPRLKLKRSATTTGMNAKNISKQMAQRNENDTSEGKQSSYKSTSSGMNTAPKTSNTNKNTSDATPTSLPVAPMRERSFSFSTPGKNSADLDILVLGNTLLSGVYSGWTVTFFRCSTLILKDVFGNGRDDHLIDWPFWFVFALAIGTGVAMMHCVNQGMSQHTRQCDR